MPDQRYTIRSNPTIIPLTGLSVIHYTVAQYQKYADTITTSWLVPYAVDESRNPGDKTKDQVQYEFETLNENGTKNWPRRL